MSYDRSWITWRIIPSCYGFTDEYNEGVKYILHLWEAILQNLMIQIFLLYVLEIHVEISYVNYFPMSSFT